MNAAEDVLLYRSILRRELVMATGCTEPIAIAYAAALARETLGAEPEKVEALCSGNIIKNVKSVVVPGTGGLRGIEAAALIGAVGGDPSAGLNVLHAVTDGHRARAQAMLAGGVCTVGLLDTAETLHIRLAVEAGGHRALVEVKGTHTNVTSRQRDGAELLPPQAACAVGSGTAGDGECASLTVVGILDYAESTDLEEETPILENQIDCNCRIAAEGLEHSYGLNIGRELLSADQGSAARAKAMAAAGSDARMSGCLMPVVINSGSGNQGLTVSMPVVQYAQGWGCGHEKLLRALLISNLVSIHIKDKIGRLSAFCGAVSAACGAGAAITWLAGGDRSQVNAAITNTLANVSGIVCDGAKPSCAAKIASAVDAALLAHHLAMRGKCFSGGDGIISDDIETTIEKVGALGSRGMQETDREILDLMLH